MSYKDWKPVMAPEDVYKKFVFFNYLEFFDDRLFWVEGRPEEGGRFVIVMRDKDGLTTDLTPKDFSARSRVYEYGGFSYTVYGNDLYFVNFKDQRIYWQNINNPTELKAMTPEKNMDGTRGKSMDLVVSPDGKWLSFVYEKEIDGKENSNCIAVLNVQEKKTSEPAIIAKGADFYKKPIFSKNGSQIAWMQWNHPYMPWNSTELFLGQFNNGRIDSSKKIAGGDRSSIRTIAFGDAETLFFTMAEANQSENSPKNFYNIYRYHKSKIDSVTQGLAEYGIMQVLNQDIIVASQTQEGITTLKEIHIDTGSVSEMDTPYDDYGSLTYNPGGDLFAIAYSATSAPKIVNLSSKKEIKVAFDVPFGEENISLPERIKFPTSDGEFAYGYLYLPKNKNYAISSNELPPVRVILHGGPTGSTSTSFSMSRTFWTSQGYAIFDVDYRGSTGYGRKYRDALLNQWGILEVKDVKDGLKYLRDKKRIGDKGFVSGGSAGGYSVQRLLTYYPELFQGGASHFGIGNLVTLQKLTHKFESRYLVQLIGGTLETNRKEYEERSPIHHLDKLAAPMIIFQGSEDKVVPPENSREMAEILRKRGIYHEYYEYEGEGHGFLKEENMVDALTKEARFFKRILSGEVSASN